VPRPFQQPPSFVGKLLRIVDVYNNQYFVGKVGVDAPQERQSDLLPLDALTLKQLAQLGASGRFCTSTGTALNPADRRSSWRVNVLNWSAFVIWAPRLSAPAAAWGGAGDAILYTPLFLLYSLYDLYIQNGYYVATRIFTHHLLVLTGDVKCHGASAALETSG
jgi:hypothetical protein